MAPMYNGALFESFDNITGAELGITRPTLYKYIGPNGELRDFAKSVLEITN